MAGYRPDSLVIADLSGAFGNSPPVNSPTGWGRDGGMEEPEFSNLELISISTNEGHGRTSLEMV
jgi:hypothetical protein